MPDVINGYKWELYNIADDYSENNDLAAKMPDKLREMQELFLVEAANYNVFPLDNSVIQRALAPRPSATAGKTVFTYSGEISGLDPAAAPNIVARSYTITADVDVPAGGGDGMIVTEGGRMGGYGLYLLKGKPVFLYNLLDLERFRWEGQQALAAGKHTIVFDFTYDGPGPGKGGTGLLSVDGQQVSNQKMPHSIPFLLTLGETFDVGVDTRTPVDDTDYEVPFRFSGKIAKLTIKLGPEQLVEDDRRQMQEAINRVND
jgi:arylsulfatase